MCMPILFCGPMPVFCGVKERTCFVVFRTCVFRVPCVCFAIWLIFDCRQHAEARTAGCKASFRYTFIQSVYSYNTYNTKMIKLKFSNFISTGNESKTFSVCDSHKGRHILWISGYVWTEIYVNFHLRIECWKKLNLSMDSQVPGLVISRFDWIHREATAQKELTFFAFLISHRLDSNCGSNQCTLLT